MSFEIIIFIVVFIYILVAFIFGILRPGIILFSSAVIFMSTGIISAEEMIAGFSNTGVLTIMLLFLVNEGIKQSGLITKVAQAYLPREEKSNAIFASKNYDSGSIFICISKQPSNCCKRIANFDEMGRNDETFQ